MDGIVVDRNETPVPGLFAAGFAVDGLDGGPNAGYVGGLIKAKIALRAAEAIAAAQPGPRPQTFELGAPVRAPCWRD